QFAGFSWESVPEGMERNETICHYCGVSYLVFHDFQQLHARLARIEAELRELRGTAEREKARREALELGRLEWKRALQLEVQRQAEEKDKSESRRARKEAQRSGECPERGRRAGRHGGGATDGARERS
uniref:Uncharacterized protein n=1 Tax=Sparus aurata TaxID=8175 RepID=A0A671Y9P2_SPAAU